MNVVIVESPAKAKTIGKYLGKDYKVLASFGHVRDLPSKSGSVDPDKDFSLVWQVSPDSKKHVTEISKAVKGADHLYLATDPDREGEAISWHIAEILNEKGLLKKIKAERISFNAITKSAVLEALKAPRPIDQDLVEAYLARLSLDYLVGFTLSPVLWRKLPGTKSAGRVQSVALRLVVDREVEIEQFDPQEYWTLDTTFLTEKKESFKARLTHLDGKKLDRFDINSEDKAMSALKLIEAQTYSITKVEKKRVKRNPRPPFTTSTLQQEASRKLGFSGKRTMQIAQKLYEGIDIGGEVTGLITYMRTDSIQVEPAAIQESRAVIENEFGKPYLPDSPRVYKSKQKNAQEAHEAIRPTVLARTPKSLQTRLDKDQMRLYELIWKRMMSSQMSSAEMDQTSVDVTSADTKITFRASGSIIAFDGFLKLYRESLDEDQTDEDETKLLPPLNEKDAVNRKETTPLQKFTLPPPRYTEASLIKKMEELGIGRPSTYTRTVQVLYDRGYIKTEKRQLFAEDRGRILTAFLLNYFKRYVEYNFTAELEEELDDISNGSLQWKSVLRQFWKDFISAIDQAKDLSIQDVLEHLQKDLEEHLFPAKSDGSNPHQCPDCKDGILNLRLGRFGPFIACSNYPECKYTRKLTQTEDEAEASQEKFEEKELGIDPKTGLPIRLKKGPYGFYVQWGEGEKGKKPKRAGLPKGQDPMTLTLEQAISLGALPREVGVHPESGEMITAGLGRFGPFIKHGKTYVSLKGDDNVLTIGLNRAVVLIAEHAAKPKKKKKA